MALASQVLLLLVLVGALVVVRTARFLHPHQLIFLHPMLPLMKAPMGQHGISLYRTHLCLVRHFVPVVLAPRGWSASSARSLL